MPRRCSSRAVASPNSTCSEDGVFPRARFDAICVARSEVPHDKRHTAAAMPVVVDQQLRIELLGPKHETGGRKGRKADGGARHPIGRHMYRRETVNGKSPAA